MTEAPFPVSVLERIATLENQVSAIAGIEVRLRSCERSIWLATGFLTAVQLIIKFML